MGQLTWHIDIMHLLSVSPQAGVSNKFLATLACYTCNLMGCLIAVKCIDRWGRRRLLLMGTSIMLLGLIGATASRVYQHYRLTLTLTLRILKLQLNRTSLSASCASGFD